MYVQQTTPKGARPRYVYPTYPVRWRLRQNQVSCRRKVRIQDLHGPFRPTVLCRTFLYIPKPLFHAGAIFHGIPKPDSVLLWISRRRRFLPPSKVCQAASAYRRQRCCVPKAQPLYGRFRSRALHKPVYFIAHSRNARSYRAYEPHNAFGRRSVKSAV